MDVDVLSKYGASTTIHRHAYETCSMKQPPTATSFKGIVVLLATLQSTSPTMIVEEASEVVSKKCSPNSKGNHTVPH